LTILCPRKKPLQRLRNKAWIALIYEDALYFGVNYPDVQLDGPVAFLHDPWLGNHGRRDTMCLRNNASRRELGLEGYDDQITA